MLDHNMDVTPLYFFFLTVHVMFGASLLILPSQVAEIAKEDMWMSVLLASILIAVSFWSAVRLARYFPRCTSVEYHCLLLGPTAGMLLNMALLLIMIINSALTMRIFVISIKTFLLDLTPPAIITGMLLLLAWYACRNGLEPLIRVQQFMFLPSYGLFSIIVLLGIFSVEVRHYQPILAEGITPVLLAVIPVWFAYSGPEIITGFLYPSMTRKDLTLATGMVAIGVVVLIYFSIFFIVQGILGAEEIAHILIPPIVAYRFVEIPDTFIERLEGYLMTMWLFIALTSFFNWLYFIAFAISQMAKLESSRPVMMLILPLLLYLTSLPPDHQAVLVIGKWGNIASLVWGLVILPSLLGLAWFKRKRRQSC